MGLPGWRRARLRERVLLWLLPALVFRALIPVGFMPGAGPAVALELCSSEGFGRVLAVYDEGVPGGHHGSGSHEPCAFAASASFGPPPEVPLPAAYEPSAADFDPRPSGLLAASSTSLRPPSRAPPGLT